MALKTFWSRFNTFFFLEHKLFGFLSRALSIYYLVPLFARGSAQTPPCVSQVSPSGFFSLPTLWS